MADYNIKIDNNKVIFDGHAENPQDCHTLTLLCNLLEKNTKTIDYKMGYAEFELEDIPSENKFWFTDSESFYINDKLVKILATQATSTNDGFDDAFLQAGNLNIALSFEDGGVRVHNLGTLNAKVGISSTELELSNYFTTTEQQTIPTSSSYLYPFSNWQITSITNSAGSNLSLNEIYEREDCKLTMVMTSAIACNIIPVIDYNGKYDVSTNNSTQPTTTYEIPHLTRCIVEVRPNGSSNFITQQVFYSEDGYESDGVTSSLKLITGQTYKIIAYLDNNQDYIDVTNFSEITLGSDGYKSHGQPQIFIGIYDLTVTESTSININPTRRYGTVNFVDTNPSSDVVTKVIYMNGFVPNQYNGITGKPVDAITGVNFTNKDKVNFLAYGSSTLSCSLYFYDKDGNILNSQTITNFPICQNYQTNVYFSSTPTVTFNLTLDTEIDRETDIFFSSGSAPEKIYETPHLTRGKISVYNSLGEEIQTLLFNSANGFENDGIITQTMELPYGNCDVVVYADNNPNFVNIDNLKNITINKEQYRRNAAIQPFIYKSNITVGNTKTNTFDIILKRAYATFYLYDMNYNKKVRRTLTDMEAVCGVFNALTNEVVTEFDNIEFINQSRINLLYPSGHSSSVNAIFKLCDNANNLIDSKPLDSVPSTVNFQTNLFLSFSPRQVLDVTTLPGWSELSGGDYNIILVAKGKCYYDGAPSESITVSKAATNR